MIVEVKFKKFESAAKLLKIIAHADRLAIIELLKQGEHSVNEIAEVIGTKQAVTSHHLNLMRDNEVLYDRRDGTRVFYGIQNEAVISLLECIYKNCDNMKGNQDG